MSSPTDRALEPEDTHHREYDPKGQRGSVRLVGPQSMVAESDAEALRTRTRSASGDT